MKKWLSLVLCLMMLCSATMALGEAPAIFSGLKDWAGSLDPKTYDYTAVLSLDGNPVQRDILHADDKITEGIIQLPLTKEEGQDQEYSDFATLQYSENGLAVSAMGQTWLIDVNSILAWIQQYRTSTPEDLRKDQASVKALAIKAALNLLQPAVTVNPENGAFLVKVDVTEKDIAERIPAFLESLSSDEQLVDQLLLRYAPSIIQIFPNFPLSLSAMKAYWEEKTSNGYELPSFQLEAEAAVIKPSEGHPFQVGLTGNLALAGNCVNYSFEFLPGDTEKNFIASGCVNGTWNGQRFDYDLFSQKQDCRMEATLSLSDSSFRILELTSSWEQNYLYASLICTENHISKAFHLNASNDESTGDINASLVYCTTNDEHPEEDFKSQDLFNLTASKQAHGIMGTVTLLDDMNIRFTLTAGNLYYHASAQIQKDIANAELDAWLFSQGNRSYRYRAEIKTDGDNRSLISGSFSPEHLDISVKPVLGEEILNLNLDASKNDEGYTLSGVLNANTASGNVTGNAVLNLNQNKCPSFLNGEVYVTGGEADQVYTLSWMPGYASIVNNASHYELTRTEDSADKLAYVLIRNKTVTVGSFTAEIGEDGSFHMVLCRDQESAPVLEYTITPSLYEEPAAGPETIGTFTGTYTEDGDVSGTLSAPVPGEEEPKIKPLDVENAVMINLNAFLRMLYPSRMDVSSVSSVFPMVP